MATDKTYEKVQVYFNFNKEVTGSTKLADSVLYSNLDPTGATNTAVEMAKIYSWAKDVFTFNPSATGTTPKITIKTSALPEDSDTTYSFQEGTVAGAFQVRENNEAWQTIAVHGVITELPEYSLANGTSADTIKLRKTLGGTTTDVSSVTLGLLDSNGKILETYLPSYVDDVIEGYYYDGKFYTTSAHTTEIPAETGKIYVDIPSNTTYRYGGTTYVPITNPVDVMTGATATTAGVAGLVPAPAAGKQNSFLRGDGTWQTVVTSDIKARQALDSSNKNYPLLFSYAEISDTTTTNVDNTTRRNNSIYVNPSTGTVTAKNFAGKINNHTVNADVPSGAVFTDTTYTLSGTTYDTNNTAQIVTLTPSSGTATTATISAMTGASSSAAGKAGLVPKPAAGDQSKFLRADGTWVVPSNTDTKVTQNISSDTTGKTYPLIFSYYEVGSTTTTAQTVSRKDTIYATPKDGSITATNFIGNINGFDFPTPASGDSAKYLRGDGTWATPVAFTRSFTSGTKIGTITVNGTGTDIYIPNMSAATASAAGTRGTVQPPAGSTDKYLRGDNTWVNPLDDIGILTLHCTNGTT
jgi:hypothetical protein